MIESTRLPCLLAVANAALLSTDRYVIRSLAGRDRAIVTARTIGISRGMDITGGQPAWRRIAYHGTSVTGLAGRRCQYMTCRFARCRRAVMTGGARY